MPRFPLEYEIDIEEGSSTPLELRAANRPVVLAGPPPEFGGSDVWWSPEHLFVSAAAACFASTLFALLKAANLQVSVFRCRAKGILERTGGVIAFSAVHLTVHLRALGDDVGRVQKLVDDAKQRCFVANSLRCPVTVSAEVHAS
jgi:organic hydroperoxide reductase OsmC/OhrA